MVKILYVEDNFQNFRLVMRMLTLDNKEIEVVQAENGETALKVAPEMRPDLIFMDINLPDIDGVEVTRRIRANESLKAIPIVALTANAMVGDRERFIQAGCDDYIRKPINREDLRRVMAEFGNGSGNGNGNKTSTASEPPHPPASSGSQPDQPNPPAETKSVT